MTSRLKILNTLGSAFAPEARELLQDVGDVEYRVPTQMELTQLAPEYDVFVIGLGLRFDKSILEKAVRLKAIATATTGLDHIDVAYAKEKGVEVISLRGENEFLDTITGTAELAFGLIIELMRKTHSAFESVKRYEWRREAYNGTSLYGKTLGIVGLGRLGKMTARYGKAFGMDIIYTDPNVPSVPGAERVSWHELLNRSDVMSIHVHLTPETENLFNAEAFRRIKPTAYLVNTSRGKIVDEGALLEALQSNKIAGYGADVLAGELEFETSGFSNYPLVEYAKRHDNVVIVPHIGGMTVDSRKATDVFISRKLARHLFPSRN